LAALDTASRSGAAVVAARFDRLARDTLQALLIERDFAAAGVLVLYAEGFNGQGDEAVMMREMLHVLASADRRRIVRRLREGRETKARRGEYAGGRPPFGYEARRGALHPVASEVEVVREIFNRVANDRWTVRQVAHALTAQMAGGRRWHTSQVGRMLKREDYKRGSGGLWPSGTRIIDPRIFNRAEAVLARRRRNRAGTVTRSS
jgi:site-specific DNA recombinase